MTIFVRGDAYECRSVEKQDDKIILYTGRYDAKGEELTNVFIGFSNEDFVGIPASVFADLAPRNVVAGECVIVRDVLYLALQNIPYNEPIVVGQNAVVTTVEEQLTKLKGE